MASDMFTIADYRNREARDMSEKQLMAVVLRAARRLDWLVYHTHDSRRSAPGFPDILAIRKADRIGLPSEILVIELKAAMGNTTPEQDAWLDHFRAAGIEVAVWRPAQWVSGEIVARLARREG